jgi:CheY-like chemotaxis protein
MYSRTATRQPCRMNTLPLRILIVDDSPDDAELIFHALEEGGFVPSCMRVDSADAVYAASSNPSWWDVVTCDVRMPGLELSRVLANLRSVMPRVPVVVVTGCDPVEVRRELGAETANGFVSKDRLDELSSTIKAVLRPH